MTRPTPAQIAAEFEQEIARAPRFCYVDRGLLQALIDDWRRLAKLCGEGEGSQVQVTIHPDPPHIAEEIRDLRRYGPRGKR